MAKRILITGSRYWPDNRWLIDAIMADTILTGSLNPEDYIIIHGGAFGADSMADRLAKEIGFQIEEYPADWDLYGKRAGYVRNALMVSKGADVCLAFIHDQSRGATMCADLAEKAGIPVKRFISGKA